MLQMLYESDAESANDKNFFAKMKDFGGRAYEVLKRRHNLRKQQYNNDATNSYYKMCLAIFQLHVNNSIIFYTRIIFI